jgi:hypothetical protein
MISLARKLLAMKARNERHRIESKHQQDKAGCFEAFLLTPMAG